MTVQEFTMKRLSLNSNLELVVNTHVNTSESPIKVIHAVANVISRCSPEMKYGNQVIGKSVNIVSLDIIYEQIRSRSAQNVLRRILIGNRTKNTTWFFLNKQAASVGVVAIIENEQESPLGPIRITLNCEDLDTLISWLVD
ncbi:MAG TPA: RNA-binding domain-containing protein [Nitrososphaeraceae archaeon]